MNKKMVLGVLLSLIGAAYSLFCFIHAATHPWDYNGIDGLLGSFLGTHMLFPLSWPWRCCAGDWRSASGRRIPKINNRRFP